ncbi:MAG: LysM peptidoglycan-binding domain-containing protein, partial [Nocardioidaceae bacterium]
MTTSTSAVPAVIRRVTRAATLAIAVALAVLVAVSGTLGSDPAPGPAAVGTAPAYRLVSATTGHAWKGHPGRWIRPYVVRRGDTATGIAVRFHAWTAELLAVNHLTARSTLYVGQRLKIPVVLAALHKSRKSRHHHAAPHKTHHTVHHRAHHRANHRAHRRAHRR